MLRFTRGFRPAAALWFTSISIFACLPARADNVFQGPGFRLELRSSRIIGHSNGFSVRHLFQFENNTQGEFFIGINMYAFRTSFAGAECKLSSNTNAVTGIAYNFGPLTGVPRDKVEKWPYVAKSAKAPFTLEPYCGNITSPQGPGKADILLTILTYYQDPTSGTVTPRESTALFEDVLVEVSPLRPR